MGWSTPKTWAVGDPATASDLNAFIRDNTAYLYGDTAWTAPTLMNGWTNTGGNYSPAGYRRMGSRVVLRGNLNAGTLNATIFTLPAGCTPKYSQQFGTVANNAFAAVQITQAGVVTEFVGSISFLLLDGLSFDTI